MILVDTSIWSAVLRHRRGAHAERGRELLAAVAAAGLAIPGVALQELLSGVRHPEQFARLKKELLTIPVLAATVPDHLAAAELSNRCADAGIAAGPAECLIAVQAAANGMLLLAFDGDFRHMAPHCPGLKLG